MKNLSGFNQEILNKYQKKRVATLNKIIMLENYENDEEREVIEAILEFRSSKTTKEKEAIEKGTEEMQQDTAAEIAAAKQAKLKKTAEKTQVDPKTNTAEPKPKRVVVPLTEDELNVARANKGKGITWLPAGTAIRAEGEILGVTHDKRPANGGIGLYRVNVLEGIEVETIETTDPDTGDLISTEIDVEVYKVKHVSIRNTSIVFDDELTAKYQAIRANKNAARAAKKASKTSKPRRKKKSEMTEEEIQAIVNEELTYKAEAIAYKGYTTTINPHGKGAERDDEGNVIPVEVTINGVMHDSRVPATFFRMKDANGKIYHKRYKGFDFDSLVAPVAPTATPEIEHPNISPATLDADTQGDTTDLVAETPESNATLMDLSPEEIKQIEVDNADDLLDF